MPPKEHVHESAHPETGEKTGYGSASGVYDKIEVSVPDIGDFEACRSSRCTSTPATPSRSTTR